MRVLVAPENLLRPLIVDEWLHDDDPQPDGTEERAEERMVWAHQRRAAATREWFAQHKAAGYTLPELNAALFPPGIARDDPDPRLDP